MSARRPRAAAINYSAMALLLAGAPLFAWQFYRLWRHTPRLPPAPGPTRGRIPGAGEELALVVIGESTAAGVGASEQRWALAASTARALNATTGRPVDWQSIGVNGATAVSALAELVPRSSGQADCVVLVLGVNDVLTMTTPGNWRRRLRRIIKNLSRGPRVPWILLAGVPPLEQFPQIGWPLNRVLGMRSRALGLSTASLMADSAAGAYLPLEMDGADFLFASDGFHPSDSGYRQWGEQLAGRIAAWLTRSASPARILRGGKSSENNSPPI